MKQRIVLKHLLKSGDLETTKPVIRTEKIACELKDLREVVSGLEEYHLDLKVLSFDLRSIKIDEVFDDKDVLELNAGLAILQSIANTTRFYYLQPNSYSCRRKRQDQFFGNNYQQYKSKVPS